MKNVLKLALLAIIAILLTSCCKRQVGTDSSSRDELRVKNYPMESETSEYYVREDKTEEGKVLSFTRDSYTGDYLLETQKEGEDAQLRRINPIDKTHYLKRNDQLTPGVYRVVTEWKTDPVTLKRLETDEWRIVIEINQELDQN